MADQGALQESMAEPLAVVASSIAKQEVRELDRVVSSEGIVHRVLFGYGEVSTEDATTQCGWKFGRSKARMASSSAPDKMVYIKWCGRCFPDARQAAKVALNASVQESGLEE